MDIYEKQINLHPLNVSHFWSQTNNYNNTLNYISNTLAFLTRLLIGLRKLFATVYPARYTVGNNLTSLITSHILG